MQRCRVSQYFTHIPGSERQTKKYILFKGQGQLMMLLVVVGGGFMYLFCVYHGSAFLRLARSPALSLILSLSRIAVLPLLMFIFSPLLLLLS